MSHTLKVVIPEQVFELEISNEEWGDLGCEGIDDASGVVDCFDYFVSNLEAEHKCYLDGKEMPW